MIVYASGLTAASDNPLGTPIIGSHNVVSVANIGAVTEADGFPAANLANPSTALHWIGADMSSPPADEYLTVGIVPTELDYIAIAGHNFGSAGIPVSVEVDRGFSPTMWESIAGLSLTPSDDSPLLFRFAPEILTGIRLKLEPGAEQPAAAVLYAGKLLVVPRGTHTDHVPINHARVQNVLGNSSESGQYLGRIIIGEGRQTPFALRYLDGDWYDTYMLSFVKTAQDVPFFFGWRPQAYPKDLGYCVARNDIQPNRHFDTQTVALEMQLAGFAA
jgi:hypothetical protein